MTKEQRELARSLLFRKVEAAVANTYETWSIFPVSVFVSGSGTLVLRAYEQQYNGEWGHTLWSYSFNDYRFEVAS